MSNENDWIQRAIELSSPEEKLAILRAKEQRNSEELSRILAKLTIGLLHGHQIRKSRSEVERNHLLQSLNYSMQHDSWIDQTLSNTIQYIDRKTGYFIAGNYMALKESLSGALERLAREIRNSI